jgi:hypothetical protein
MREIAERLGLSERTIQTLVNDLVANGYLDRVREGRRNRYVIRDDLPVEASSGSAVRLGQALAALVPAASVPAGQRAPAVVLACSDRGFRSGLGRLLVPEGLAPTSEVLLWPGGPSAIAGPDGGPILAALASVIRANAADRLVLVAHAGCTVPGAFIDHQRNPLAATRLAAARRRRIAEKVRRRVGLEPELWFDDGRSFRRVRTSRARPQHAASRTTVAVS